MTLRIVDIELFLKKMLSIRRANTQYKKVFLFHVLPRVEKVIDTKLFV